MPSWFSKATPILGQNYTCFVWVALLFTEFFQTARDIQNDEHTGNQNTGVSDYYM